VMHVVMHLERLDGCVRLHGLQVRPYEVLRLDRLLLPRLRRRRPRRPASSRGARRHRRAWPCSQRRRVAGPAHGRSARRRHGGRSHHRCSEGQRVHASRSATNTAPVSRSLWDHQFNCRTSCYCRTPRSHSPAVTPALHLHLFAPRPPAPAPQCWGCWLRPHPYAACTHDGSAVGGV
jgi:hypothetical protein